MFLLERTACLALQIEGGNAYALVEGVGTAPGFIHSDSAGSNLDSTKGPTCGSNKVLAGKFAARIRAAKAPIGTAVGQITTAALSGDSGAVPTNAYDSLAFVVAEGGTVSGSPVIGRTPVDKRYATGVRTAISSTPSYTYTEPTDYTLWTGGCGGGTGASGSSGTATKVFVNCPNFQCSACDFPHAQQIVVNGKMTIKNGGYAKMPVAQRLYVKGVGSEGLNVNGQWEADNPATPANESTAKGFFFHDAAGGSCGTSTTRAQLIISNGAFTGGSPNMHLCNTTVIMADGYADVATNCRIPVAPFPVLPAAPGDNPCYGYVNFNGTPDIDWTAPNLVSGPVLPPYSDWTNLEDLALWSESSGRGPTTEKFRLGGGAGVLSFAGVYFAPNASPFEVSGQADGDVKVNAQFIARRLTLSGKAKITMVPDPNNSVTVPLPPSFGLVR
jgi:hypothetical protein